MALATEPRRNALRHTWRPLLAAAALLLAPFWAVSFGWAFTEKEIEEIFQMLDTNGDGKVTREEYSANKIGIFYHWASKGNTRRSETAPLSFDETPVSRAFFDALDTDHDGTLSPLELIDGLRFEDVDTNHKGYIDINDVRRFLTRIGR